MKYTVDIDKFRNMLKYGEIVYRKIVEESPFSATFRVVFRINDNYWQTDYWEGGDIENYGFAGDCIDLIGVTPCLKTVVSYKIIEE